MRSTARKTALLVIIMVAAVLGTLLLQRGTVTAQPEPVPRTLRFVGLLTNPDGTPVADETILVAFRLYGAVNDLPAQALWDSQLLVEPKGGVISVTLGDDAALPLRLDFFDRTDLWLGVQIEGDQEMQPRFKIASVPYALRAQTVAQGSVPSGMIAMFDSTCPEGWTRFDALDGRFPRGAETYGDTGGSETHDHGLTAHTHTGPTNAANGNTSSAGGGTTSGASSGNSGNWNGSTQSAGAHNHNPTGAATCASGNNVYVWRQDGAYGVTTTDGGHTHSISQHRHSISHTHSGPSHTHTLNNHTHGFTTSSAGGGSSDVASSLPPYVDVVYCKKD